MTINGGAIYSNVVTKACVWLVSQNAKAWSRGIRNYGTLNLNSGTININAESSVGWVKGATAYGKTYAYAYGVMNEGGTVNKSNNIVFSLKATADTNGTNSQTKDEQEIIERTQTTSE